MHRRVGSASTAVRSVSLTPRVARCVADPGPRSHRQPLLCQNRTGKTPTQRRAGSASIAGRRVRLTLRSASSAMDRDLSLNDRRTTQRGLADGRARTEWQGTTRASGRGGPVLDWRRRLDPSGARSVLVFVQSHLLQGEVSRQRRRRSGPSAATSVRPCPASPRGGAAPA